MAFGHFHRPVVEHLGSHGRQFQHLVIGDVIQFPGPFHHPGIGGIDPIHIGINDAFFRPQCSGQGHRRGVRAAPADGGDILLFIQALEAGHHHDLSLFQLLFQPGIFHKTHPGHRVLAVGAHPGLPAGEGHRRASQLMKGHGEQGNGNLLSGGKEHIHLPRRQIAADFRCFFQQFIGGISLGGDHCHHLMALLPILFRNGGHMEQALFVPHRGAAEFQYHQRHAIVLQYLRRGPEPMLRPADSLPVYEPPCQRAALPLHILKGLPVFLKGNVT